MPLTLVATAGDPSANAYVDVSQADAWAALRVGGSAWLALTPDQKVQALVTASQDLDALESAVGFCGVRASDTQALAWPRTGTDYADDEIPVPLQRATIELAMSYAPVIAGTAAGDVLSPATNGNVKREKAGPVETEYFASGETGSATLSTYPLIVQRYLVALVCTPTVSGYGTGTAIRSS